MKIKNQTSDAAYQWMLRQIKQNVHEVDPDAEVWLYGSRARRDARDDSDWDVLILLDKAKVEATDYDNVSYPLVELGWSLNECISPVLYTIKDWLTYHFTPFFHNIKKEGILLL